MANQGSVLSPKMIGVVVHDYMQGNALFDISNEILNRDDILLPFYECKKILQHEHGVVLETVDLEKLPQYDAILFFCSSLKAYSQVVRYNLAAKSFYVVWEPPVVDKLHEPEALQKIAKAFAGVLTWQDDLLKFPRFFQIRYAQSDREWRPPVVPYEDRCLLVNISGNKSSSHKSSLYAERKKVLQYIQSCDPAMLQFYGPGWDPKSNPSYRGMAPNKAVAYSNGKFALCLENMHGHRGYITEKIFDCFKSGIVPVYLGSPDIDLYVPKGSYIPYSIADGPEQMLKILLGVSESEHSSMVEIGKAFAAKLGEGVFSTRSFADNIVRAFSSIEDRPLEVSKFNQFRYLAMDFHQRILKRWGRRGG